MIEKLNGPWRITFDTNPDICNINCIMCEEHSGYNTDKNHKNRLMDFNIIKEVIEVSIKNGLKEVIPSTMGEPLLYPEFENLIHLIKKYNLRLNLTTNGTFPKYGVEYWADLIFPVASDIKISLNGASKLVNESIMKGIIHEKQIENIQKFVEMRDMIKNKGEKWPSITIQVTFMERNLNELQDILKLAIKMKVDRFKGHHLWITHPQVASESLKRNEMAIKRWNRSMNKLISIVNHNSIILENIYPLTYKNEKNILPDDYRCPFLGKEAWIAWDGTFNVCCAPENLRKTSGSFGSVRKNNLIDLWNDKKYNELVNNWGVYEVCKLCNMRKPSTGMIRCANEQ